jgi:transposase InsO family protein
LKAENAALRHQLIVLRRKVKGRVRLTNTDRWFLYPAVSLVSVNPAGPHDYPSRDARALASGGLSSLLALEIASTGRATADRDEPARTDPADERRKSALGRAAHPRRTAQARLCSRSIKRAKYMVKRRGPPSQGWRTFLQNHAPDIAAMDLFVVPTIGFDLLYAFVIVRLDRRDLVWINVTANPTAEWIAHQITEAFPWNETPQYLIRDRDRVYGTIVTRRLRAMGIRDKPTAPASPWQNGFAERLIGSIRRECVDHIVVWSEAHLRRILKAYARYYNDIRTHRSLDKDAPLSRPVQRTGSIKSHSILGGLHHHYVRA